VHCLAPALLLLLLLLLLLQQTLLRNGPALVTAVVWCRPARAGDAVLQQLLQQQRPRRRCRQQLSRSAGRSCPWV
jgi:hypothetical protein